MSLSGSKGPPKINDAGGDIKKNIGKGIGGAGKKLDGIMSGMKISTKFGKFQYFLLVLYAVLILLLLFTQRMIADKKAKLEEVRQLNIDTWTLK